LTATGVGTITVTVTAKDGSNVTGTLGIIVTPDPFVKHCLPTGVCFDNRVFLITDGTDGNFIDSNGRSIDSGITKYYSKNAQKEANFLVIFKDWDSPPPWTYSVLVNRDDTGMGMGKTNLNTWYGAKGNLKSFVIMPNIKLFSADFDVLNVNISTFAHEIGHHWLAYFGNPSLTVSNPNALFHYNSCMIFNNSAFADLMMNDVFIWQKTGDNIFTSPPPDNNPYNKRFSDLSLYVMGLLPDTGVTPVEIIRSGLTNCPFGGSTENGIYSITGSVDQISLLDLIKIYGARSPSFVNTQKDFTVQIVLLVHQNSQLNQSDADTFTEYLDQVEQYLPFAVSNKATFQLVNKK
jgi:hypothetical protein